MLDILFRFADNAESALQNYATLLAFCEFNRNKKDKNDCLTKTHNLLQDECGSSGTFCTKIMENAASHVCGVVRGYEYCKNRPTPQPLKTTAPPTTPSTTTLETVTETPFPIGTVIGGFLLGVLFSLVLMTIVFCFCMKKRSSGDEYSSKDGKKKKSKKRKHGTTTGSGTTGSFGTTDVTSTGASTTEKKKKKKKKGKKGKKGKTDTTQTHTATAY